MSLIDFGPDGWLSDLESCGNFYLKISKELSQRDEFPKDSIDYNSLGGTIRLHLEQFNDELLRLESQLGSMYHNIDKERERRQRRVEDLQSKWHHLSSLYKNSTDRNFSQVEASTSDRFGYQENSPDEPLLGEGSSISALKQHQKAMIAEQDEGLDRLANIISRSKTIAITIGNEVGSQNELIDQIGERMDAANSRIHGKTNDVGTILKKDSSCCYWIIILLLFSAIIGVSFAA